MKVLCQCGHGIAAHYIGPVTRPHNRDTGYVITCRAWSHDDVSEWGKCDCSVLVLV